MSERSVRLSYAELDMLQQVLNTFLCTCPADLEELDELSELHAKLYREFLVLVRQKEDEFFARLHNTNPMKE